MLFDKLCDICICFDVDVSSISIFNGNIIALTHRFNVSNHIKYANVWYKMYHQNGSHTLGADTPMAFKHAIEIRVECVFIQYGFNSSAV